MENSISDSQIDNVLIDLKQKEIDEQIRSNKVIEGVLMDISNSAERIVDSVEMQEQILRKENDGQ